MTIQPAPPLPPPQPDPVPAPPEPPTPDPPIPCRHLLPIPIQVARLRALTAAGVDGLCSAILAAAATAHAATADDKAGDPFSTSLGASLATCQWVRSKQNVIAVGQTGVGKSYIGASLAQAACRNGFRALCTRVPRLLQELVVARADGSYVTVLSRIAKVNVLVLDDFLISPLRDTERRDLLEILEDRYGRSSTVITSQLPTKNWHESLSDPTLADAICDRLVHNAHVLSLRGPSIRKKKGMNEEMEKTENKN